MRKEGGCDSLQNRQTTVTTATVMTVWPLEDTMYQIIILEHRNDFNLWQQNNSPGLVAVLVHSRWQQLHRQRCC